MAETTADPYRVLGVRSDATEKQVRAAYRRRIRETHPDMGGDPAEAARVNLAWTQLKDPNHRQSASTEDTPEPEPEPEPEPRPRGATQPDTGPRRDDAGTRPNHQERHQQPEPTAHDEAADQHDSLRAAANKPIRPWWASPYAWAPAGVWLITLTVTVFAAGADSPMTWMAASLYVTGTWLPVGRRGLKLPAAALVTAIAIDVAYITAETPMVFLLASTLAVWGGVAVARRTHLHAIYKSLRAQYALACTFTGMTGWVVLAVEPGGASTRCLLENETTGRHTTRSLWGRIEAGDRVALTDNDPSGLPDMILPVEAQQKQSRRRNRR